MARKEPAHMFCLNASIALLIVVVVRSGLLAAELLHNQLSSMGECTELSIVC
jgi:hypothetical protein